MKTEIEAVRNRFVWRFSVILGFLLVSSFQSVSGQGQDSLLYGGWYSDQTRSGTCLVFNKEGNSQLDDWNLIKLKYYRRNRRIKFCFYYSDSSMSRLFPLKWCFEGKVMEHSDSTLVIEFEEKSLTDHIPIRTMRFERMDPRECLYKVLGYYEEE